MRVIWKDSNALGKKPMKYRNHIVSGCPGGWKTDLPEDDNIYKNHYSALNAIDKHLDGFSQKGSAKRKSYGIQIVEKTGN